MIDIGTVLTELEDAADFWGEDHLVMMSLEMIPPSQTLGAKMMYHTIIGVIEKRGTYRDALDAAYDTVEKFVELVV